MGIELRLRTLPNQPGVYLMKDAAGKVIYVGKATSLKARVRSYFQPSRKLDRKTQRLVADVADLDYMVTDTEVEALILEDTLIKQHRPHYNVRLRDDKTYPYIKVTIGERFPRVYATRRYEKDGSKYFGPYTDVNAVRETLRTLKWVFPVRQCSLNLEAKLEFRPCLNHHIRRCLAPCAGEIGEQDYGEIISQVILFLQGRQEEIINSIKRRMEAAADALKFEHAAVLRDQMNSLMRIVERQKVVSSDGQDMDAVAIAVDADTACAQVFFVRCGKVVGRDHFLMSGAIYSDRSEVMSAFLKQYYAHAAQIPAEVIVDTEIRDRKDIEAWLKAKSGHGIKIHAPKRGHKKSLIDMVGKNAESALAEALMAADAEKARTVGALIELAARLGFGRALHRLECYDISNVQGTDAVGSMVVFESGRPAKSQYRRFRIRGITAANDFAMMAEVLSRRFSRAREGDSKFSPLPDLVIVDGGKGQLNAARTAMVAAGAGDIPTISLAKENEEVFVPDSSDPVHIPRDSHALHLLQRIRDEAHRFAVEYHRTTRGRRGIKSELSDIEGIGKKRLIGLMRAFGSLAALSQASLEQIRSTPGMTGPVAERVYAHLHPEVERREPMHGDATDLG